MKTTSLYIAIILVTMSCNLFAQDNSDFIFFESRLQTLANKILTASNDSLKEEANKLLIEDVEELLLVDLESATKSIQSSPSSLTVARGLESYRSTRPFRWR